MQTVLLPTDFSSNAFNAIRYAIDFFENEPCRFLIFHAYEMPTGTSGMFYSIQDMMEKTTKEDLLKELRKVQALKPQAHHQFEVHSVCGPTIQSILNFAEKEAADVLILGTQGASGIKERFIGSNAAAIIRDATLPVIAVPQNARFQIPERIAFATDLRPISNEQIMAPLIDVSEHFQAQLMVFHTYDTEELVISDEKMEQNEKLKQQFRSLKDSYHYSTSKNTVQDLARFIEEKDVQLLAMITRRHTFFERIFNPSSVEKMAFHTHIPLLALHN